MNSNNDVDMAAAIIMCSVEAAAAPRRARGSLGVPARRAPTATSTRSSRNRDTFARTPAIELGGKRALELAGVGIDDIAVVDLYSCFPSAVQLGAAVARAVDSTASSPAPAGCRSPADRGTTTSMHAIATVVDDLREQPGEHGLVWANGGYATKHAFGVYSHRAAGRRLPPRLPAGRDRRASPAASWPSRPTPPARRRSRPTP